MDQSLEVAFAEGELWNETCDDVVEVWTESANDRIRQSPCKRSSTTSTLNRQILEDNTNFLCRLSLSPLFKVAFPHELTELKVVFLVFLTGFEVVASVGAIAFSLPVRVCCRRTSAGPALAAACAAGIAGGSFHRTLLRILGPGPLQIGQIGSHVLEVPQSILFVDVAHVCFAPCSCAVAFFLCLDGFVGIVHAACIVVGIAAVPGVLWWQAASVGARELALINAGTPHDVRRLLESVERVCVQLGLKRRS